MQLEVRNKTEDGEQLRSNYGDQRCWVMNCCNTVATVTLSTPYYSPIGNCDEVQFWLSGYVNKQNCRIWSEANPQVYVETPLNPEKLTVWCALWAGEILLQKR
ncbi:hypothetical protein TNCV_1734751 [Trichonephila clavipes]|nr:hypothetical protein TNCV_1734751 [Trichonephila clavipes]